VLRAPADGVLTTIKQIGDHCEEGDLIASVQTDHGTSTPVHSPFAGVLRGLIHDGIHVTQGLKVGDVDARNDARACFLVSDKSLAIGGAVLEAVLMKEDIRGKLFA
jgi:xanthine dehydrogenase accessory factor